MFLTICFVFAAPFELVPPTRTGPELAKRSICAATGSSTTIPKAVFAHFLVSQLVTSISQNYANNFSSLLARKPMYTTTG
jgi:hypothetical protein